jgi:hypothetical protein
MALKENLFTSQSRGKSIIPLKYRLRFFWLPVTSIETGHSS